MQRALSFLILMAWMFVIIYLWLDVAKLKAVADEVVEDEYTAREYAEWNSARMSGIRVIQMQHRRDLDALAEITGLDFSGGRDPEIAPGVDDKGW